MKTFIAVLVFSIGSVIPSSIASAVPNTDARANQGQEIKNANSTNLCWWIGRKYRCF